MPSNALSGNLLVLKTPIGVIANQETTPADSEFNLYIGFQSNNFDFSASIIDVTNKDSDENMTILNGHGIRSVTLSGSGFLQNKPLVREIEDNILTQSLRWFQLDRPDGRKFTALFKMSSYSFDGAHDTSTNFSLTLNSSGEVFVT